MARTRKIKALLVSYMPTSGLRCSLYRSLLGYEIGQGSRIGLGVMIAVDSFTCGRNVTIRRGTSFMGPIAVSIGDETFIGRWNRIECGDAAAAPDQAHMNYARSFEVGQKCLINESHLFDVLGRISVGDGTWIAGFASQFLTHGAGVMNRDIAIGDDCFVGSAVRFAPSSGVGHRVMVGMGSVVTKRLPDDDVVVAGLPAKVIRQREADDYSFKRTW